MLVDDWKRIAKKAWSFRLIVLAAGFSWAEWILPTFQDAIPRGLFALLAGITSVGAAISRVISQPRMHDGE